MAKSPGTLRAVTKNDMSASAVLPRSYGVWLATNGQATIVDNVIRSGKVIDEDDDEMGRTIGGRSAGDGAHPEDQESKDHLVYVYAAGGPCPARRGSRHQRLMTQP